MTKDDLKDYRALCKERMSLEDRIARLEQRPDAEQKVLRTLEECYKDKLKQSIKAALEIEKAIDSLNAIERELIRARYVDGMEWEDVASHIGYSWQQTHRIHAKALEKLEAN